MDTVKGIYHFNDEDQEVALSLLKDKLLIVLKDNRQVFWYYEQVKRESLYQFRYTDYPPQSLQVSTSTFADQLEEHVQKGSRRPNVGKAAPLARVLFGVLFFLVLAYFLVVPWVASLLANRFPIFS